MSLYSSFKISRSSICRIVLVCFCAHGVMAAADFKRSVLPQGNNGISQKYPGDVDISQDKRVVFSENFEEQDLRTVFKRWDTVGSPEIMSLSDSTPKNSAGKRSFLMTHVGSGGTMNDVSGAQLYTRLDKGYDQLYTRMYVKFSKDCFPIHHFGTNVGGNNPATRWPMVDAGNRPAGDKTFWVGIEPFGEKWTWDFYAYSNKMKSSPPGKYWGNTFIPDEDPRAKVQRGQWICIEFMVKMNTVDEVNATSKDDGELALWIDGKLVSHLGQGFPHGAWIYDRFVPDRKEHGYRWNGKPETIKGDVPFEGLSWRTIKELQINYVWLYLYYQNTPVPVGKVNKVWYDDVVLATEYIGPLSTGEE